MREAAGHSQSQMRKLVGSNQNSWFTQLEDGTAWLPSEKYKVWADALQVDRVRFVKAAMAFYDPVAADILGFSSERESEAILQWQRNHAAS